MDADEYLPFASRIEFEKELDRYNDIPVILMPWLNLVPQDMESERVKAAIFLMPPRAAIHHKIVFQPNLIPLDNCVVAQGNHRLLIGEFNNRYLQQREPVRQHT